jgi:DNA-directed RNA polymerase subunit RPC12/RpoP
MEVKIMEYENICTECGKPFKTYDEDMNYCGDCWDKVVLKGVEFDVAEVQNNKEDDKKD